MEMSTFFPRHLEKHKFLLRSIEGVAFLKRDIGNYPCLTETSTTDCCDMGQNDTIDKIELNPSFVSSSNRTNCKNDIQ